MKLLLPAGTRRHVLSAETAGRRCLLGAVRGWTSLALRAGRVSTIQPGFGQPWMPGRRADSRGIFFSRLRKSMRKVASRGVTTNKQFQRIPTRHRGRGR